MQTTTRPRIEMSPRLAAAYEAVDEAAGGNPEHETVVATIRGLMYGYDARWGSARWQTVSVEESFHLPITNPDTGKPSRTFTHGGKVDGIVEYDGRLYLRECKTTSDDIGDPNGPFWRRLAIDAQVSGYVLSQWQMGRKLDGTLYDVIRKPGIRPKHLGKADAKLLLSSHVYHGRHVSFPTVERIAEGETLENGELFEARLAAATLERPDWYYQRKVVNRVDMEVAEYATELWETADEIRVAVNEGRHYRNPGACLAHGHPCRFLSLCSGHDTPDSDRWAKKPSVHPELPFDGDGRTVLTHTRMQTFRTCRRKHFYEYVAGITPNRDESESLFVGRLTHCALAAFWAVSMEAE